MLRRVSNEQFEEFLDGGDDAFDADHGDYIHDRFVLDILDPLLIGLSESDHDTQTLNRILAKMHSKGITRIIVLDFIDDSLDAMLLTVIYSSWFAGGEASFAVRQERARLVLMSIFDWNPRGRKHGKDLKNTTDVYLTQLAVNARLFAPSLINQILRMLDACPYLLSEQHE